MGVAMNRRIPLFPIRLIAFRLSRRSMRQMKRTLRQITDYAKSEKAKRCGPERRKKLYESFIVHRIEQHLTSIVPGNS